MTATQLFPTSVIGSLPRPKWVLDLLIDYQEGRLDDEALDRAMNHAVPLAIGLQEVANIDIISDGEWRRIGYFEVFAQMVGGFQPGEYKTKELAPSEVPDTKRSAPQQWTLNPFKQALVHTTYCGRWSTIFAGTYKPANQGGAAITAYDWCPVMAPGLFAGCLPYST